MSARSVLLQVLELLEKNRWGTCVDCPRGDVPEEGRVKEHPQIDSRACENTMRYDHWLLPQWSSFMTDLRDLVMPELAKSVEEKPATRECPFHVVHNTVQVKIGEKWCVVAVCHHQATAALVAISLHRMGCDATDFEHLPSEQPGAG